MCLVVFAWKMHPEYRLVLAANRDEFHERPARELHWWPDYPDILAGRDLQAGGTWLAVSKPGRFATVTNYREQLSSRPGLRSRGEIITNFVGSKAPAGNFVASLESDNYAGFSLLAADRDELWYVSNRGDEAVRLAPGIYGLSNASLDTPWSKLVRTRDALRNLTESGEVDETALLRIMADRTPAPSADVEAGNLPFVLAKALTAPHIVSAEYGTRCSTALTWSEQEKITVCERRFDAAGTASGDSRYSFAAT
jgi:uncharacterized protein with NRDE domain